MSPGRGGARDAPVVGRPISTRWRLISRSTVPRSMPPSNDELIASTRVIRTPRICLRQLEAVGGLTIDVAHGEAEQQCVRIGACRDRPAPAGAHPRARRARAPAARPASPSTVCSRPSRSSCSRAGEPGARAAISRIS